MNDVVTQATASATHMPRKRSSGSWRGTGLNAWLAPVGVVGVLALLVVPPILVLAYTSLTTEGSGAASGAFTLEHFRSIFDNPRLYVSAWNSLLFSALSTILSVIFGGLLAWVVVRTNAPFGPLAYITAVVSLGTPYLLHVAAWTFLLGRTGPFNEAWRDLTGSSGLLMDVYSMWGMVLIQGMLWSPLVFLLMSAVFRRANAEMEEAARMCGASILQTVWNISFKLAWPAITGMALFVFIRNLESFDVPVLIGGPAKIYVLTTDIYLSMTEMPPKMGHATAFSLILIAIVSVALVFYSRFARNADRYASVTGKGFRPRPFDLGKWRWLGGTIVIANFVFVLLLPLLATLWISLMPFARPIRLAALKLMTLENYHIVLSDSRYLDLTFNTIVVAAGAATAAMALALIAGWLVVRRWPGGQLIEQLINIPIVFPGIVVGVALLILSLRVPFPLYGTLVVIMLAFVIRFLPYGMRYAHSGVMQIHRELEEAAGVSGAGQLTILRRIVLPLLVPALLSGWLFIFLIGANELSMSVLLSGPQTQVMAVAMLDQWSSGQSVELFALGMCWSLFMTVCALIFYALAKRTLVGAGEGGL
ncbi:MAG: ABC transporter permease [Hyphomicrobiaceae bacterium]